MRSGSLKSCHYVRPTWERRLMRAYVQNLRARLGVGCKRALAQARDLLLNLDSVLAKTAFSDKQRLMPLASVNLTPSKYPGVV